MNKLTPEQALADIRAVCRDRADSHWLDCAIALSDEVSRLRHVELDNAEVDYRHCKATVRVSEALGFSESAVMGNRRQSEFALECVARMLEAKDSPMHLEAANLRAELDALKSAPDATEPPAPARFLPSRPADVPAPPDGVVFVNPCDSKVYAMDDCVWAWNRSWPNGKWNRRWSGHEVEDGFYVGIEWTAPADIWHRFGLLAPSEGGGWIPHTPGDAMPCEGLCEVLLKGEIDDAQFRCKPGEVRFGTAWCWDADHSDNNAIGWRPAEVAK